MIIVDPNDNVNENSYEKSRDPKIQIFLKDSVVISDGFCSCTEENISLFPLWDRHREGKPWMSAPGTHDCRQVVVVLLFKFYRILAAQSEATSTN